MRQRMIYIRHYFPGVDIEQLSDEDFAMLSEDALWLHEQMVVQQSAKMLLPP